MNHFRLSILYTVVLLFAPLLSNAEEETQPLYEKLPFNRITLSAFYGGATFDIQPITFRAGVRPNPLPQNGKLTLRFVNNPLKEYQINWNFIARVELFSELVRDEFVDRLKTLSEEVNALSPKDNDWKTLPAKFDRMFDYLRFLERYRSELSDYAAAEQRFLFAEGMYRVKSGDFQTGLMRFESVFAQNPAYSELETAWASALQTAMDGGKEPEYIHFLVRLMKAYPENAAAAGLMNRFLEKELKTIAESKHALEQKDFLAAHLHSEEALKSVTGLNGLIQWFDRQKLTGKKHSEELGQLIGRVAGASKGLNDWQIQLNRSAVRVDVAVNCPAVSRKGLPSVLPDWAAERTGQLISRMMYDYVRPGLDGGVYTTALGTSERIPGGLRLTVQSAGIIETAQSLFNCSAADIDFLSGEQLEIRLRHSALIPEALFAVPLKNSAGNYRLELNEPKRSGFLRTETADGPNVIFEHTVFRSEEAIELLLNGKVDVIDRLAPWAVNTLKDDDRFVLGRYTVPTVYFLTPNLKKPLTASRTFRRALLYGLNRSGMLQKLVSTAGQGTVLSAPFIKGRSLGDPLGYGYDSLIEPRMYEPKLATALSLLAFNHTREKMPDWNEQTAMPEMVLVRPKNETAEYIALMIRRQWQALGVPVKIIEERDNEPIGQDDAVDFWLVERSVKEPLVDAAKILGKDGLCGTASPYMELALEKLELAPDWAAAGKALQNIHQLCFEETTVLPLWQLTEYYVHRIGVSGISGSVDSGTGAKSGLINLYRNAERWTVLPRH